MSEKKLYLLQRQVDMLSEVVRRFQQQYENDSATYRYKLGNFAPYLKVAQLTETLKVIGKATLYGSNGQKGTVKLDASMFMGWGLVGEQILWIDKGKSKFAVGAGHFCFVGTLKAQATSKDTPVAVNNPYGLDITALPVVLKAGDTLAVGSTVVCILSDTALGEAWIIIAAECGHTDEGEDGEEPGEDDSGDTGEDPVDDGGGELGGEDGETDPGDGEIDPGDGGIGGE